MDTIKNHISFIAFTIIALIICWQTNGFKDNTWIISILSSIIGGIFVNYITPAIALRKLRLTNEEKNKVRQGVKLEMRNILNRLHNNSSQALGVVKSLVNNDKKNKDYKNVQLCLRNTQEDLNSLEKYLNHG